MMDPVTEVEHRVGHLAARLRGTLAASEVGRPLLIFTFLRRLDCLLAPTRDRVKAAYTRLKQEGLAQDELEARLCEMSGFPYFNSSGLELASYFQGARANSFETYLRGFSTKIRRILDTFDVLGTIRPLQQANLLDPLIWGFANLDLDIAAVPPEAMGRILETLAAQNDNHFRYTPRDLGRLGARLLFGRPQRETAADEGRRILDPICGSGGLLIEARRCFDELHPGDRLEALGQDLNSQACTVAAILLLEEPEGTTITEEDSLLTDRLGDATFDYFFSCPPFGMSWRRVEEAIQQEHRQRGFGGRFGAGLPRYHDASLLYLQHMWHKRLRVDSAKLQKGSRLAIFLLGSSLFVGNAGSGESEIRRWLIENDWLEAIIALPSSIFPQISAPVFLWLLDQQKESRRRGKVQLIDARELWTQEANPESHRLQIGRKTRHINQSQIDQIVRIYTDFEEGPNSRILDGVNFGYTRIVIERPLRLCYRMTPESKSRFLDACPHLLDDVQAIDHELGRKERSDWDEVRGEIADLLQRRGSHWQVKEHRLFRWVFTKTDPKAEPVRTSETLEADSELRSYAEVPLTEAVEEYYASSVKRDAPDAWLDRERDRVGYKITFDAYFQPIPPRTLAEIDADLLKVEEEFARLLRELVE